MQQAATPEFTLHRTESVHLSAPTASLLDMRLSCTPDGDEVDDLLALFLDLAQKHETDASENVEGAPKRHLRIIHVQGTPDLTVPSLSTLLHIGWTVARNGADLLAAFETVTVVVQRMTPECRRASSVILGICNHVGIEFCMKEAQQAE